MIEIIEKERYYDDSPFTGQCFMYPTYMVKDGKEYFMFNRREPDDSWKREEMEQRKRQLIETGGAYFKFNGFYSNPAEMILEIASRRHHFTEPDDLYYGQLEKGVLDFHGNLKEVSAAFFYRIYDGELARKVQRAVEYLNREEWEKASKVFTQEAKHE